MEGTNEQDLIDQLLKENMEANAQQEEQQNEGFKSGNANRDNNGFIINFQGKKNEYQPSRMKFLPSDKVSEVKDHYLTTLHGGGEKKKIKFSL